MIYYSLKTIRNFGSDYHHVLTANNKRIAIEAVPAAYRDRFNQAVQDHKDEMNKNPKIDSLEIKMGIRE